MGKTPQFLAHILIKFVAVGGEKYNEEEDGFGGFGVNLEIIKSRTNQAGQSVHLTYDKVRGMDICFVTTAKTDEEARELLTQFGMPFKK